MLQFLKKPSVYLSYLMYLVNRVQCSLHRFCNDKDAFVCRVVKGGTDIVNLQFFVINETVH